MNCSDLIEYYCAYNEGSGNGVNKIKVIGDLDLQKCANKCFQMKLDGNGPINGATLDKETCYCEENQTRTWYSKQKKNCFFKTDRKPISIKGGSLILCLILNIPKYLFGCTILNCTLIYVLMI